MFESIQYLHKFNSLLIIKAVNFNFSNPTINHVGELISQKIEFLFIVMIIEDHATQLSLIF